MENNDETADLDGLRTDNALDENDVNKDKLSRENQEKIEKEIAEWSCNFPFISEKISLDLLSKEYDPGDFVYQTKVNDLKQQYNGLRKTRPDGNCFYRAFIFNYFESLFDDVAEQKRFLECCNATRKKIAPVLGSSDFIIEEFYEYFTEIITSIQDGKITTSSELHSALVAPAVYDYIVVYLRLLTSYYIQKEPHSFVNFVENSGKIKDFCKEEVEPMYKESDHVHISALCSVLDVTVRIVYMDRAAGGKVNEHDFYPLKPEGQPKPAEPTKPPRIHLLYRPGHYDVLYVTGAIVPGTLVPTTSPLRNEPGNTSNGTTGA